jgi:hypothetical protein
MKRKIVFVLFGVTILFCSCTSYKKLYYGCSNDKETIQKQNEGLINQNMAKVVAADSLRKQNELLKQKSEDLKAANQSLKTDNANIKN